MGKSYEGMLLGKGLKFGVVVSRFNELVTSRLLEGAKDAFMRHGVADIDVDIAWAPGCLEIPLVAKKLVEVGKYDGIVCLGAVIRGGTAHFEYVAAEVNKGIARLGLDTGVPVIQGVITADTLEQAIERAGAKAGNRGFTAATSAIEMGNLVRAIGSSSAKK